MKKFRKNVAIAIDGGGIRGVIPAKALAMLEKELGRPLLQVCRLTAGTSTGAIITAGIASGLSAGTILDLYLQLGREIFKKSWRTFFWPLTRYRYPQASLEQALRDYLGDRKMGAFWSADPPTDVVITAFDLLAGRSRFIKPWKPEYKDWSVIRAVLVSSAVPTYFPVVDGRYVDGGVGSYANPCYLAAYESAFCLKWKAEETTLISLGTGRDPQQIRPGQPARFMAWDWIDPLVDGFLRSADDQQVHLVDTFFYKMDFRRFQVDLQEPIPMDDPSQIDRLLEYGEELGYKILEDRVDSFVGRVPPVAVQK